MMLTSSIYKKKNQLEPYRVKDYIHLTKRSHPTPILSVFSKNNFQIRVPDNCHRHNVSFNSGFSMTSTYILYTCQIHNLKITNTKIVFIEIKKMTNLTYSNTKAMPILKFLIPKQSLKSS